MGILHFAKKSDEEAVLAFVKALALDAHHVPSVVNLARTYLRMGKLELAEGLLLGVTRGRGWDNAWAW